MLWMAISPTFAGRGMPGRRFADTPHRHRSPPAPRMDRRGPVFPRGNRLRRAAADTAAVHRREKTPNGSGRSRCADPDCGGKQSHGLWKLLAITSSAVRPNRKKFPARRSCGFRRWRHPACLSSVRRSSTASCCRCRGLESLRSRFVPTISAAGMIFRQRDAVIRQNRTFNLPQTWGSWFDISDGIDQSDDQLGAGVTRAALAQTGSSAARCRATDFV